MPLLSVKTPEQFIVSAFITKQPNRSCSDKHHPLDPDTSLLKPFRAFLYLATDLLPKRRHGVVKLHFYRDTDACVAAP